MNEYFECKTCGQVVQGWNASRSIRCCEAPDYVALEEDERKFFCAYCGEVHDEPLHICKDERRKYLRRSWASKGRLVLSGGAVIENEMQLRALLYALEDRARGAGLETPLRALLAKKIGFRDINKFMSGNHTEEA